MHCLLSQLQFTLLINFDVKTNEIRQVIKAGLIVIPFRQHLPPVHDKKLMKTYLTAGGWGEGFGGSAEKGPSFPF